MGIRLDELIKIVGVRYYTIGNHSVMYAIEKDTATVIHVAYGRQDLNKIMADYK
ncbi:MAG: hypothetical protein J6T84_06740 [Spirochaetaceae bacterium]|nr:hypothetical protein [Spirochaetaceae bacterium]